MQAGHGFRRLPVLTAIVMALTPFATRAASPAAGIWTLTGAMHQARAGHTATLLPSGLVLIAGGIGASGPLAGAELYHPHTGSWAGTGSMHEPRMDQTSTLLPTGQVLVAGGCTAGSCSTILASAELYHP